MKVGENEAHSSSKVSQALMENFRVGLSPFSGGEQACLAATDCRLGIVLRKRARFALPDGVCGSVRMTTVLGVCVLITQLPAFLSVAVCECIEQAQFILVEGFRVLAASSSTFSANRCFRLRIFDRSTKIDPCVLLPEEESSARKGSVVRERSEWLVETSWVCDLEMMGKTERVVGSWWRVGSWWGVGSGLGVCERKEMLVLTLMPSKMDFLFFSSSFLRMQSILCMALLELLQFYQFRPRHRFNNHHILNSEKQFQL